MHILAKGILIAIEGIDGSGKSTLARNLHIHLMSQGLDGVLTREPGASALGRKLRTILQEKDVNVGGKAEFLLFAADRAQHFEELIIPALDKRKLVISDRMADSSLVYQGYGRGLDLELIHKVNDWCMQGVKPDLVLYIQVPIEIALQRITKRKEGISSFERERIDFTQRLVEGFEKTFRNREDVIIVDGTLPVQEVCEQACQKLLAYLKKLNVI